MLFKILCFDRNLIPKVSLAVNKTLPQFNREDTAAKRERDEALSSDHIYRNALPAFQIQVSPAPEFFLTSPSMMSHPFHHFDSGPSWKVLPSLTNLKTTFPFLSFWDFVHRDDVASHKKDCVMIISALQSVQTYHMSSTHNTHLLLSTLLQGREGYK